MTSNSIIFPGLNIVFNNVGRGFSLFGFPIAFYGVVIALGMVMATLFISYNAKSYGESSDLFFDMTGLAIVAGVIGARLYYVIFSWDMYKDDLISILNLRAGGLAIYGGIIGGIIMVLFFSKKKDIHFLKSADILIPGVLIGQIFGRYGNFFNREAFGGYSSGLFRMGLPIEGVRSLNDITEAMMENSEVIDGVEFVFVHPTFLYESTWNLCTFIILFFLGRKKHKEGMIFAMYLLFYGIGRFFIESLRTDQLKIANTNIPVSMVVSLVCILVAIVILLKKPVDR